MCKKFHIKVQIISLSSAPSGGFSRLLGELLCIFGLAYDVPKRKVPNKGDSFQRIQSQGETEMNRLTVFVALVLALVASSHLAFADNFTFTAVGAGFQSSGTITATADVSTPNVFDVTAISGEVNNVAITGLLPCANYSASHPCTNTNGVFIYDNLLGTLAPVLDYNGIGFNIGNAGYQGNFYFNLGNYQFLDSNNVNTTLESLNVAVAPTPEPSTFVFLGTGLLAMAGLVRSRFASIAG